MYSKMPTKPKKMLFLFGLPTNTSFSYETYGKTTCDFWSEPPVLPPLDPPTAYLKGRLGFLLGQLSLVPSVSLCTHNTESERQGTRLEQAYVDFARFVSSADFYFQN